MKEASYYNSLSENKVQCQLCPNKCIVSNGKHGICLTRECHKGILYTTNYLRPVSTAIDPIEKKPLYNFYPGSSIFSAGPNGCTFKCNFCQNHEISQSILRTQEISINELVNRVKKSQTIGIAYTYSEPYIWFETIMDVGEKIKELDLFNVMVTNGYMEPKPLTELLTVVDAMNIDIKSINPDFYQRLCKSDIKPVLRTCETVKKKCHLEITNLLITDENDSEKDIQGLVDFIAVNLGKDTPLHISRYFPRYKMNNKLTPETSLLNAYKIACEKLDYVYLGNISAYNGGNTYCPACNTLLVERNNYLTEVSIDLIKDSAGKGLCKHCGFAINVFL